jgi:uncharacterized repeat protein (TIGR03803 family)
LQFIFVALPCVLSVGATIAPAQTVIHRFSNTNGESPWSPPFEGFDTNFYGTTSEGGAYQSGTVYKLNPEGKQVWVYSFCATSGCPDGAVPLAGIVQAATGWLFGTAWLGGANAGGTEFMMKTNGKGMTTLHSFCQETNCADGDQPQGTMVATNMCIGPNQCGTYVYSTTLQGGASGHGAIYQTLNAYIQGTVYSFCSLPNCADGDSPAGPLIQASDGNLYGTTEGGGAYNFGTVFQFGNSGFVVGKRRLPVACDNAGDARS